MDKSIRELPDPPVLPDFRNLGVALRLLLGGVVLAALAALVAAPVIGDWHTVFIAQAVHVVPVLLATLGLCVVLARPLARLPGLAGAAVVVAIAVAAALAVGDVLAFIGLDPEGAGSATRSALLAAAGSAGLLAYFHLRARAMRPADAAARFAALSARIRPHFLFNSLNAVLSLIRSDPRRAESALESLAELFRALMREPRELVPLSEEIALCRQYIDLERLRLGDRLTVNWEVSAVPGDARVPQLMLQPLIENAIYHGIEPADEGGAIAIRFTREDEAIVIELDNPAPGAALNSGGRTRGNHLALANVRERLDLHYDLEARLETSQSDGRFRVRIVLPYRTAHDE
jgi:two-component system sensor histidine kinase AlgZ